MVEGAVLVGAVEEGVMEAISAGEGGGAAIVPAWLCDDTVGATAGIALVLAAEPDALLDWGSTRAAAAAGPAEEADIAQAALAL